MKVLGGNDKFHASDRSRKEFDSLEKAFDRGDMPIVILDPARISWFKADKILGNFGLEREDLFFRVGIPGAQESVGCCLSCRVT